MVSEDVVGVVARGIYAAFARPLEGKRPFFDQLPADARLFLRAQARAGIQALRNNVTDSMVASAEELGDGTDYESIFVMMIDAALKGDIQ
jgi:hypothetical protein